MIRILFFCGLFLISCCPARDSSGNYWKPRDVRHRIFSQANSYKDIHFPLPGYADTANGLLLGTHWHSQLSGDGEYDSIGRLIRVDHGRLPMWEMVYDHGKWVPYAKCSYCKMKISN